jgi:subtilisin-like proprotein convertase family protein
MMFTNQKNQKISTGKLTQRAVRLSKPEAVNKINENSCVSGNIAATAVFILLFLSMNINAQMFWNQAGNFEGSNYAAVPNSSSINITGGFTLECWVYKTNNNLGYIIHKSQTSGTGYSLYISSSGFVTVGTNGAQRLSSTTAVPLYEWVHIAATYTAGSGYNIYIDGVADGTVSSNSNPAANTDSLLIGKRENGFNFPGLLDEVRIWNRPLSGAEISRNMRTSLGATGGAYNGLVLALTFQDENSNGTIFNFNDWSGAGNTAYNRGCTAKNFMNEPSRHLSLNESLKLDGVNSYFAVPSHSSFDLNGESTFEAWVYMANFTSGQGQNIISKGIFNDGYSIFVTTGGVLGYRINATSASTGYLMPVGRWVHVAFTIDAANLVRVYVNGTQVTTATRSTIISNTDSLFIGKSNSGGYFDGFIDEVRISKIVKSPAEIKEYLYKSVDASNDLPGTDIVWNFDGLARDNGNHGTRGYFRGNALFSNPATQSNIPVSPMVRADNNNFTSGFNIKTLNRRIPETGTSGNMTDDSIVISSNPNINDINLFVGINHTLDANLEIILIAPNGDSVNVCSDFFALGTNDNIVTIFDDNADSTMTDLHYTDISSRIKPQSVMNSVFSGDNPNGVWRLRIRDDSSLDTGRLYAWGIQINNSQLTAAQNISNEIPVNYDLMQNYPNPFNPVTNIRFSLPQKGFVTLKVFDITGREVRTLVNNEMNAGTYNVDFDASNLSSGTYFYKIETTGFSDVKKMVVVK